MIKMKRYTKSSIYPPTSFFKGLGNVLNIAGHYFDFRYSPSESEADRKAVESDWKAIGDDIMDSINVLRNQIQMKSK
jgi:hypothetical protein